jgi:hypothetical protein
MKDVDLEPAGIELFRAESVGGAAVGDERALAVRGDEDADAARPRPGNSSHPGDHAVALERLDQRAPGRIAPDRGDERGPDAESRQPARGVRRRAAGAQLYLPWHVRAELHRSIRRQDDVEHEVAEHDRPHSSGRRRASARKGRHRRRG